MLKESAFLLAFITYCAVDAIPAGQFVYSRQRQLFELSIVHINDFHARFVETSATSSTCHKGKEDQCIGGLGRLMTITRRLLGDKKNVIFLNAGDNYQGTLWYNIFKWNVTAHFMNKLPHDAMTIGNHEFDDGIEGLLPFLRRVRAPVVVANIDDSEEPTIQGLYKRSYVIVRDNQPIGVIGVIDKTSNTFAKTGRLKLLDEVKSINSEAEQLKAQGVNVIIVLSHAGLGIDRRIAENCPQVDAIVGGHSHSLLYTGKPPFIDVPVGEYPVVVRQSTTNRTVLIVQAGAFNKYVGNLSVWFDEHGEVAGWDGNPIFLGNSVEQDLEMAKELQPWSDAIDAMSNRVVGETRSLLNDQCHEGECILANLITDAMVNHVGSLLPTLQYKNKTDNPEHWTYAAISCMNAGGIRSGIPIGSITYGDLRTVQPFENTWNTIELKGGDLRLALEESVTTSSEMDYLSSSRLLHWSGINVVYNMSMPAWLRVKDMTVRCQRCSEPRFESLDRDKWYRIVVSDFILGEGDGLMTISRKHRNFQAGPVDIDAFSEFVEIISPINYGIEHRLQFVGK